MLYFYHFFFYFCCVIMLKKFSIFNQDAMRWNNFIMLCTKCDPKPPACAWCQWGACIFCFLPGIFHLIAFFSDNEIWSIGVRISTSHQNSHLMCHAVHVCGIVFLCWSLAPSAARYAVCRSIRAGTVYVWNLTRRRFVCRPVRVEHGLCGSTDVVLAHDLKLYILTNRSTVRSVDAPSCGFQVRLSSMLILCYSQGYWTLPLS